MVCWQELCQNSYGDGKALGQHQVNEKWTRIWCLSRRILRFCTPSIDLIHSKRLGDLNIHKCHWRIVTKSGVSVKCCNRAMLSGVETGRVWFGLPVIHCVPRAPVREVSSRLFLFACCLNPYNTMHFTRFRHRRNATFYLN